MLHYILDDKRVYCGERMNLLESQTTDASPSTKQTGYSVYWKDAKKRIKHNTLAELYPKLPTKKFDIIYADPPWDYNGKIQFDNSSVGVERIDLSRKILALIYLTHLCKALG